MDLSQAIAGGSKSALQMARSFITKPALASYELPLLFYIAIDAENITQHADAQVSESVLYTPGNDTKTIIADNVAPGPWQWTITGYLSGSDASFYSGVNFSALTEKFQLQNAFKRGARLVFKDTDCTPYHNVVIQSLDFSPTADCKNRIPVSMTIKEINVLTETEATKGTDAIDAFLSFAESAAYGAGVIESTYVGLTQAEQIAQGEEE